MVRDRATTRDIGLLAIAIVSIASSAILARWAEAPALALAFWRTLGGAVALVPAAWRSQQRPATRQWAWLAVAGTALAVHFATWLASLELTTVASSVTLVATAPVWVVLGWWALGHRPTHLTLAALGVTLTGAVVITGGGAVLESGQLGGDGLALIGAVAMAGYLMVGQRLRAGLSTAAYAAPTYGIAAFGLLVASTLSGTPLVGFDPSTWLAIVLMTIGPQLLGHTVLNELLPRLGSVTVSLSLLAEPIGAAAMAWLFFAELPPVTVWVGAPLVLAGLALQILRGGGVARNPQGSDGIRR